MIGWPIIVLALLMSAPPAVGHPVESFRTCSKAAAEGVRCRAINSVLPGKTAYLRGRLEPKHVGYRAQAFGDRRVALGP